MLMTDITIRAFTGTHVRPYLSCIARLSAEIFQEYPYLCQSHERWELEFLEKYAESDDAIVVIVFDGSVIVGASTGIPLIEESGAYLKPFQEKRMPIDRYFHFGESFLLKPYRNRGIGHHFFDLREEHVEKSGKYDAICFCSVDHPEHDPLKPSNYRPLDDFWRKRGFTHHKELVCHLSWKNLHDNIETTKNLSYWIKELHQPSLTCTSKEFKNSVC